MIIKSNQYGFPGKTYFYIEHEGYIWHHSDNRWRKKTLIQLWSHGIRSEEAAKFELKRIPITPRQQEIADGKLYQVAFDGEPDNVLLEGTKTECMTFIKQRWPGYYKSGKIRLGKILYEPDVQVCDATKA